MVLRVRSKAGMWRVPDLNEKSSQIRDVKAWIEQQHKIAEAEQVLSIVPPRIPGQAAQGLRRLTQEDDGKTLKSLGLRHGDVLELTYDGNIQAPTVTGTKKVISADGSLKDVSFESEAAKKGFRPGLKSLRDMKMHWTIGEFMRMDAEFEFKIQRQKQAHCAQVSLDSAAAQDFQLYLRQFAFQQSRVGWLYGRLEDFHDDSNDIKNSDSKKISSAALVEAEKSKPYVKNAPKVVIEAIYEPPQEGSPSGFEVLDDPNAAKADAIADALGLQKVGWIFSHPPREEEHFEFSSREVMLAAQLQMDAGGAGTPFVTLKVSLNKEGQTTFEAFQVSDQCLEMFSAGALEEDTETPMETKVQETYTAIVEGRPAKKIDNNFFLMVVPVVQHDGIFKSAEFPHLNREGAIRTRDSLKEQLTQRQILPKFADRIADFQMLIFLADFLDLRTDIPSICQSILHEAIPVDEGFQVIINSFAGIQ